MSEVWDKGFRDADGEWVKFERRAFAPGVVVYRYRDREDRHRRQWQCVAKFDIGPGYTAQCVITDEFLEHVKDGEAIMVHQLVDKFASMLLAELMASRAKV